MLIALSDSLRHGDLRRGLARDARDALINLSTAAYEGNHLIAGSRLLFGDLQQLAELGPIVTGRFKEASARGAEALALVSEAAAVVRIEPIGTPPSIDCRGAGTAKEQLAFHVPLDHFKESVRLGPSWIVAEHSRDLLIYISLGEAAVTRHRGLRCNLRGADGHGGATHRTFQNLAEQQGCVLCIVDSDRTGPGEPMSQTATQVTTCRDTARAACKVATAHVLPCRELENLLPKALVLDALPNDPKDPHRLRVLASEDRLGRVDFEDIKDLVKLQEISEHFARLTPPKRAQLCFTEGSSAALSDVGKLVLDFGVASQRGRT